MSLQSFLMQQLSSGPKSERQLKKIFGKESRKIQKLLKKLKDDGKISYTGGLYILKNAKENCVEGKVVKLGRSFGFVSPLEEGGDIFVPGHALRGALAGDEVLVLLSSHPRVAGSREGEVLSILRPVEKVVGTAEKVNGRLALIPDNMPDTVLYIKKSEDGGAVAGEKIAGELLERGQRHDEHRVGVILRFGSADSAAECAKALVYAAGVSKSFPEEVKQLAKEVSKEKITEKELENRIDLRQETIFTIDSASTKDIDDAISIQRTEKGYRLGVHIADVSHYVRPKSELDQEAMKRATSIYYADVVIPMLPKALSNGICSLNPKEDRLAFTCYIDLDKEGRTTGYKFAKSVIQSKVQGVYSEINQLLAGEGDKTIAAKYQAVQDSLFLMKELYEKLAVLRRARGCIEIDSEEAALVVDEQGVCVGVEKRSRGISEHMIEEFMLLANASAAHLAKQTEIPFVYRVHETPGAEKVEQLDEMLKALGVEHQFKAGVPSQLELSEILDKTRNSTLSLPVHTAVLRSMAKAKYEPIPKGHYGLALEDYAHFTSPIRRYPDLAIHRILGEFISGMKKSEVNKRFTKFAEEASRISSERELEAQRLERDCDDCYKAEYMRRFVGECFDGVITSVTQFGIYVALENSVEGLVHISHLDKGHLKLQDGIALADAVTGARYQIGEPIRVRVSGVHVAQGNVDFVPADIDAALG